MIAYLAYLGARVRLPGLSFQVNDSLSRISGGSSSATRTEFSGK